MTASSRKFGKYEVFAELGRGGFAVVYKARDTTLDRDVALKLLHAQFSGDPAVAERFIKEAKTVANLDHANIVTVYEVGNLDGQLFIAMELVDGGSLLQRLQTTGAMSLDETVAVLDSVADALDYAHSQDLVHRDVKPANILLKTAYRQQERPLLTDFGLVKALSASSHLTRSDSILGTVEYMAPEQIDFERADEIGPATDIYALGVVAYHMLTGQVPFSGSTVQVINGHLNKKAVSPSELRADLPAATSDVILKAMAKEPQDRYPSAAAFVDALQASTAPAGTVVKPVAVAAVTTKRAATPASGGGQPPSDIPPVEPRSQPENGGRSSLPVIVLAIIAIVAVAGLGWMLFGRESEPTEQVKPTPTPATVAEAEATPAPTATVEIVEPTPTHEFVAVDGVSFYSSLDNLDSIRSPERGGAGETSLSEENFVPGKVGSGAYFNDHGKWARFPVVHQGESAFSLDAGEIEFWYRPDYDAVASETDHYFVALGDIYNPPFIILEKGGFLGMAFVDADYNHTAVETDWLTPLWEAGEWIQIRAVWDNSRSDDAMAIYLNGERVDNGGAVGGWDLGDVAGLGSIFVGAGNENGDFYAEGVIDELVIRSLEPVNELVTTQPTATVAPPPLSGQIVFTHNQGGPETNEITLYDLETLSFELLTSNEFDDHIPRWSPDGSQIAFTSNRSGVPGAYDIWVMDGDGSNQRVFVSTGAWDEYAAWEPNGGRIVADAGGDRSAGLASRMAQAAVRVLIAFSSTADTEGVANAEIFVGNENESFRQTTNAGRDEWPSWSPDGRSLAFGSDHNGDMDIYAVDVGLPLSQPRALYISGADENQPSWSPDGQWIVYVRKEHAADAFGQLMLGTPDGRTPTVLTDAFAATPAWSPDGEWIVFARGVDVDGDGELTDADESDIWALRLSDNLLTPLIELPGSEWAPSWGEGYAGGPEPQQQIEPTPTALPPTSTALPPTPTTVAVTPTPPGDWVEITGITIGGNNRYVVDFRTSGYEPRLGGGNRHVHFFWNTVPPEQAGMPGSGPWQLYPTEAGVVGESPFRLFRVSDRPGRATQICALVANSDHSVEQGTGNCVDLPG
ncbi:MAG: PD40 domain-containing protein [Caldilineales bacterium]|nr:PD40 domain-containing protein [Caldilineales bacterium]